MSHSAGENLRIVDEARSAWAALPLRRAAMADELERIYIRHYIAGVQAGRDAVADYLRGRRANVAVGI